MIMTVASGGGWCINLLMIMIIIVSLLLASPCVTSACHRHGSCSSPSGLTKNVALQITEGILPITKANQGQQQPIAPMMLNKMLEQQDQDSRRSVRSLHNVPSGPNPISNATPKGYRRKARSPPQQRH